MVDDYKADLLSIRAYHAGGRLCGRCEEFFTINRSGICPTCIQILTDNRIEDEAAIEAQESAWAAEDAKPWRNNRFADEPSVQLELAFEEVGNG